MNLKNNKGYMLVEIILASAIAFGIAYFITALTIKIKNKNDDTLVMSQVATDQTIITNGFMREAMTYQEKFDCSKINVNNNKIIYGSKLIDIVSSYANVGNATCSNEKGKISIYIPMEVVQLKDKDYNVRINYKYLIDDITPPRLEVDVDNINMKMTIKLSDNEGIKAGNYIIKYASLATAPSSCDKLVGETITLNSTGEKEITKTVNLTDSDNIRVCNQDEISDIKGNKIPANGDIISVLSAN